MQEIVVYNSLNLQHNESMEYLESAIKRGLSKHPSAYFIDIICTKPQLETATVYLDKARKLVAELNPTIPKENMEFAITTDPMIRMAALKAVVHTGGDAEFRDINPNRETHL